MPLYDFKCNNKKCKTEVFETFMSADDVHKGSYCPNCKVKAKRIFYPNRFKIDFKAGFDVGQGEWFDSAAQRDESAARAKIRRIKD